MKKSYGHRGVVTIVQRGLSFLTRHLPDFRGAGRLYGFFNRWLLAAGSAPLQDVAMRDGTTMRIDLRSLTDLPAAYTGRYDRQLLQQLQALHDPDDIFLDVGANIGYYSVAMGHWLRQQQGQGKVIAFEPLPANFDRLRENIDLNHLAETCVVQDYGLSDRSQSMQLTLREDFVGGAQTGNAALHTGGSLDEGYRSVAVSLERLDDVIGGLLPEGKKIGSIKLDIEGHEDLCIRAALDTIAKHRPVILMEVNKPYYRSRGEEIEACFAQLLPAGYALYRLADGTLAPLASLDLCQEIDNVWWLPDRS